MREIKKLSFFLAACLYNSLYSMDASVFLEDAIGLQAVIPSYQPHAIKMTDALEPVPQSTYPLTTDNPPQIVPCGKSNVLHKALIHALKHNEGFEDVKILIDRVVSEGLFCLDDMNEDGLSPLMIACGGYRLLITEKVKATPA
jgi:ankyrin repeat protein